MTDRAEGGDELAGTCTSDVIQGIEDLARGEEAVAAWGAHSSQTVVPAARAANGNRRCTTRTCLGAAGLHTLPTNLVATQTDRPTDRQTAGALSYTPASRSLFALTMEAEASAQSFCNLLSHS